MEVNLSLLPWQEEVWNSGIRFQVIAAGRRCGKTRYACCRLLFEALSGDPQADYLYVAPTQGQARRVAWKLLLDLGHEAIDSTNINNLEIRLKNGSIITLQGADRPETMRGLSMAFAVIDEYADIKPYVWEEIVSPALADREGSVVFIGTPMGRNHFYELYKQAELGDDPEMKSWHFTSRDNPVVPKREIEKAKLRLSSYAFRQEYEASFEARGSQLFKDSWIEYGSEPDIGDWYIAVDPAGFENVGNRGSKKKKGSGDETAIAIVKVNDKGWYVHDIQHGRWDLNETAIKIFEAVRIYKPVMVGIERGIAQQAILTPLSDLQRRSGRFFHIELLSHGNQKKTDRIVWSLQGKFENGWIKLNKGDWNAKFLDELFQFPDPLTNDDLVDALSYIDQMAEESYVDAALLEQDEWQPLDLVAGY